MATNNKTLTKFRGRLLILGFGCIGRAVLPLLLRHAGLRPDRIRIVTDKPTHRDIAEEYRIGIRIEKVTPENYRTILSEELKAGDFLLNLSIGVSSVELIAWCHEKGVLYLDACIEPWEGGYYDTTKTASQRSNYGLREEALALRRPGPAPTAVLTHGVNPGLVSHFVKQALLDIAAATGGLAGGEPRDRAGWAGLAHRLGIKVIHVAERDTQVSAKAKRPGEFVNTWSVEGFAGEGCQPAELGWGSHERHFPADGHHHGYGCDSAIYLDRPGAGTRVRSWTPLEGPYHGFLITHGESISIADYLTVREGGRVTYRPTVHYTYHPCDDAVLSLHELAGKGWRLQQWRRELGAEDIEMGMDELGVLLAGHAKGAYWYGSRLTIGQARALCPLNNATSLQTAAGVLGGVVWAMRHPDRGIVDPDEMEFREVLEVALPYLGEMVGKFTDWTPLEGRGVLFPEDVDATDPWQFKNVRV
jgi:homospermidine synthase